MSRHQAVRYDVKHGAEVFSDSPQEEQVVLPLIEDRLPIATPVAVSYTHLTLPTTPYV